LLLEVQSALETRQAVFRHVGPPQPKGEGYFVIRGNLTETNLLAKHHRAGSRKQEAGNRKQQAASSKQQGEPSLRAQAKQSES
jgi:hypothetical protein